MFEIYWLLSKYLGHRILSEKELCLSFSEMTLSEFEEIVVGTRRIEAIFKRK